MRFWNIFDWFVSTDKAEVINKIDDHTYLRANGTVYREQGDLITGSDGSVMTLLDGGQESDSGLPRIAVRTCAGGDRDPEW